MAVLVPVSFSRSRAGFSRGKLRDEKIFRDADDAASDRSSSKSTVSESPSKCSSSIASKHDAPSTRSKHNQLSPAVKKVQERLNRQCQSPNDISIAAKASNGYALTLPDLPQINLESHPAKASTWPSLPTYLASMPESENEEDGLESVSDDDTSVVDAIEPSLPRLR